MVLNANFVQAVHDNLCDTVSHIHGFGAVLRDHSQIHRASVRKLTVTVAVHIFVASFIQHLGCLVSVKFQRTDALVVSFAGRRNHTFSRNLSVLAVDGGCQLIVIDCIGSSLTESLIISRSSVFTILHLVAAGEIALAEVEIRCALNGVDDVSVDRVCIVIHGIDLAVHHSHHQSGLVRIALYGYFINGDLA